MSEKDRKGIFSLPPIDMIQQGFKMTVLGAGAGFLLSLVSSFVAKPYAMDEN